MRKPAPIKPWLSAEDLQTWVREARDRNAYQKSLAIWLTFIGPYPAHHVATLLGISKPAVWLWLSEYNRRGPDGLEQLGEADASFPWNNHRLIFVLSTRPARGGRAANFFSKR